MPCSELGLNKVADTFIGSASVRGVSGGERKRANIGVELIKNPSALFLDEPTSGLDSFQVGVRRERQARGAQEHAPRAAISLAEPALLRGTRRVHRCRTRPLLCGPPQAQSVMTCMGRLAANGRTVVASIHQPRSSIYALFDQLYLISEGRTMFAGPAGQAVAYFAALDPAYACPALFNPADWFLDLTSADYRGADAEKTSLARIDALAAAWHGPHGAAHAAAWDAGLGSGQVAAAEVSDEEAKAGGGGNGKAAAAARAVAATAAEELAAEPLPTYQSSFVRQVQLIGWRSGEAVFRNKSAIVGKIAPSLFFALVLGAIYSGVENNQKGIQDKIGALFFFTINQSFGNMFAVLSTFSEEKIVVERERASKSYRLSSFYIGKLAAELPMNLVGPVIFGSAVYWLVGLNDDPGRFFAFLLILIETGFAAIGLGMVVAAAAPNAQVCVRV